ncbi:helix-turn-helix domain-containing protein [Lawsonia intracellularis]|nr:helix-turn-helix transcriptional regulator [Lawsonia intracellularis]AGC50700.1 hypothetical protein LAW_30030 [Lawsonia intracellularis N343]
MFYIASYGSLINQHIIFIYKCDYTPVTIYKHYLLFIRLICATMDRELIKKVLGLIIKNFREEQGLSRYIVAKESGLDSSWLRRLEDGKSGIRTETLILIARGLKLPAATIITKIEQALENPDAWLANYRTTSDSI